MSSPARLILLSGTGGSGTSTIARATLASLEDEGLRAVLIDADDDVARDGDAIPLLMASADALAGWTRSEALDPALWSASPSVRHLATWLTIIKAVRGDVDAVVVDCGDLRQARDLVSLPLISLRLVESALTPATAMRRATEDRSVDEVSETAFDRLARLRDVLVDAVDLMHCTTTTMRLVTSAVPASAARVLRAASALAMLGIDVDGIVATGFGRKSDDVPADVRAAQATALAMLEQDADGPLVWKSGTKIRPVPKGRSAMGPLGASPVLRADVLVPEAREEEYSLMVPLGGVATEQARVGRVGDYLVVAFDGLTRTVELPSMLRRCTAMYADRTADGLRVAFVPDSSLWRGDAAPASQEGSAA